MASTTSKPPSKPVQARNRKHSDITMHFMQQAFQPASENYFSVLVNRRFFVLYYYKKSASICQEADSIYRKNIFQRNSQNNVSKAGSNTFPAFSPNGKRKIKRGRDTRRFWCRSSACRRCLQTAEPVPARRSQR